MLTIGYIGLGLMGKSIARNIRKAGFPLRWTNSLLKARVPHPLPPKWPRRWM
jgi:3-hydroxyisobutyrate dehydrogenase-like beta-hydroxyacid dehydrogenase